MGLVSCEQEIGTSIPAAKMFKAFVLESNTFIPKVLPQAIKNVEILQGDGGVGTIKKINFGDASEFKYVKERVDAIDKDSLTYAYTVIEGDMIVGKFEKISNEIKFVDTPTDGGSLITYTNKYFTVDEFELKQDDIQAAKGKAMGLVKAVEAYLLANPDAL